MPHHVTQRDNQRQVVFHTDDDRRAYLELLRDNAARYGLVVHGYSLMSNHAHLLSTPQAESSLARAVGRTHLRYTLMSPIS